MNKEDSSLLIKKILKENNLTQQGLANILDESRQYINQVANGKIDINKKLSDKIKKNFPTYILDKNYLPLELPDKIDFNYLEFFRKHYGYTQAQIAELISISQDYYSKLETNKRNITEDIINKIKILNQYPNKNVDMILSEISSNLIKIKYQPEIYLDKNYRPGNTEDFVYFDKRLISNKIDYNKYTILSLKGDFLKPLFNDSDKIIIEECYNANKLIENEIYAFYFKEQFYIRRFEIIPMYPDGELNYYFNAINKKYNGISFPDEKQLKDIKILCRIISKACLL